MESVRFPLADDELSLIKRDPWLNSVTSANVQGLRALIDTRCAGISSPWVRGIVAAMLQGPVVGLKKLNGRYYVHLKHSHGGPDHFVPRGLSGPEVVESMPWLNATPEIAELFGQCHGIYVASTSCGFADFQKVETFRTHRDAFDMPAALQILDARSETLPHSAESIDLAGWFIFFYDGSGQVLGMNSKAEIAWYLHDHQRIVIMPLTLRDIFKQIVQTPSTYPWFDALVSMESAGVSFAFKPAL